MENKKTAMIADLLRLRGTDVSKSFYVFDHNDEIVLTIGKPRLTETDSKSIRQFLSIADNQACKIKLGKNTYLCTKGSTFLLGRSNFNAPMFGRSIRREIVVTKGCEKLKRTGLKKATTKPEENLTIAAKLMDNLTFVLVGQPVVGESFVEDINQASEMMTRGTVAEQTERTTSTQFI